MLIRNYLQAVLYKVQNSIYDLTLKYSHRPRYVELNI